MAIGQPGVDPLIAADLYGQPDPALPWPPQAWFPEDEPSLDPTFDPGVAPPPVAEEVPQASPLPFDAYVPSIPPHAAPAALPVDAQPEVAPAAELAPVPPIQPHGVSALPDLRFSTDVERAVPKPLSFLVPADPNAPLPSLQEEHEQDPFAGMTSEQVLKTARNMAITDPIGFADLQAQHEMLRQKRSAAEAMRIEDENIASIEANRKMRAEAAAKAQADTEKIIAQADELSRRPIDRRRWFSKKGTGDQIATVIGALVGGLMSKAGGPNHGIGFIQKMIDEDVEDQKSAIEQQRDVLRMKQTAVGQAYAMSGDLYQAADAARIATYNALKGRLLTEQQNYDPRGTTFLRYGALIQQMHGAAQKAQADSDQRRFENGIKLGELQLKADAAATAKAKARAAASASASANIRLTPQQLAALYPGSEVPRVPMTQKEYGKWLEVQGKGAELSNKRSERPDQARERERQFAVGGLSTLQVGPDGKPVIGKDGKPAVTRDVLRNAPNADGVSEVWLAPSPEREKEIAEKTTAARQLVKLYDRALALRDRVGGETGLANSDEYQELKSLEAEIKILRKQGTQGMSSDADMENLAEAGGARDLTSFRSKAAGLKAARARVIDNLNETYRVAKYTGPDIVFPEPVQAKDTPFSRDLQVLKSKPSGDAYDAEARAAADAIPREDLENLDYASSFALAPENLVPISAAQREALDRLAVGVASGSADAKAALTDIARTANSLAVRRAAKAIVSPDHKLSDVIERSLDAVNLGILAPEGER